jgi:hypothetical protein
MITNKQPRYTVPLVTGAIGIRPWGVMLCVARRVVGSQLLVMSGVHNVFLRIFFS